MVARSEPVADVGGPNLTGRQQIDPKAAATDLRTMLRAAPQHERNFAFSVLNEAGFRGRFTTDNLMALARSNPELVQAILKARGESMEQIQKTFQEMQRRIAEGNFRTHRQVQMRNADIRTAERSGRRAKHLPE